MFINSKKNFEIREGNNTYIIPRDFIGEVPGWVASHWLVQAAVRDGSIATPENTADRSLETADRGAAEKAAEHDIRPEETEPTKDKGKGKSSQ